MKSDGSTASYYELPEGATELQHLISHRDMNAQMGEIFRACYRYGQADHSDKLRDAKKIKFYIEAEIARLNALQEPASEPANEPESEWGEWIEWEGGECPVARDARVEVEFRSGVKDNSECAWFWTWFHPGLVDDIIRYRVKKG